MNIAIIGGGFAGLTAAHELLKAGHQATVFEAAPQVGGLASGFRRPGWEWSLERFYHHIFTTDRDIRSLADEVGAGDMIFWSSQTTAFYCAEHGSHPVTTAGILSNPHVPFVDRVRFGVSGLEFKFRNDWRRLERETAERHLRRWAGPRSYEAFWKPLLDGKFGPYAGEVNAAWMWARAKTRSFKLGYFRGGFQAFADALAQSLRGRGAAVHTSSPVQRVVRSGAGWSVVLDGSAQQFDRVIVASAPGVLRRLAPELPEAYGASLGQLRSMGAVVMVLALGRRLLTGGEYWLNIAKGTLPFLALVEHTNLIPARHYGGDRLVYCGDYLPPDHRYFSMSDDEVKAEWIAALPAANAAFDASWIHESWLFRERYAQPIVPVNHSRNVPALKTPLPGLYWASLSHVYPWDRGTNFAVELGRRVVREVLNDAPVTHPEAAVSA